MAKNLLDQDWQLRASILYEDTKVGAHVQSTVEAAETIEEDLNFIRTNHKASTGLDKWTDEPSLTVKAIYEKIWPTRIQKAGFSNVSVAATGDSVAFDSGIKTVTTHNDGTGSSTVEGVVLNATEQHELRIRDHTSRDAIDDGFGNEVYGRLSHSTTPVESGDDNNQLSAFTNITGVTDDNTDAEKALHFSIVDDTGGFFHVDIYDDLVRTSLVGHTGTYNSTGAKAITADNASGLGGTVTVDAVTAVDVDIKVVFGQYKLTWYSFKSGSETAFTFGAITVLDLSLVRASYQYQHVPYGDLFMDASWHDVSGLVGSITDDDVAVDGMTLILNGLTTQAAVNLKLDKLGSTANGEGLSGVALEDASGYYTGTDGEGAFNNVEAAIGGTGFLTFAFTESVVCTDDSAVRVNVDELNSKWGDLASTALGEGAAIVGSDDAGNFYPGDTTVEAQLQTIGQDLLDIGGVKTQYETTVPIAANTNWTLPGAPGLTYTPAAGGANMDVHFQGNMMFAGTIAGGDSYEEVSATQIKFRKTIATGRNLVFVIRK